MCRVLIFGGTTEGRLLAEFCMEQEIPAFVSVVSGYGADLLPESRFLHVVSGRMTAEEMESFLNGHPVSLVCDATHPYAAQATDNIKEACKRTGTRYVRVIRKEGETCASCVRAESVAEAVRYLRNTQGRILVTTGSRELSAYGELPGYEERIFARVLPACESISACESMGLRGGHIIAMQGPFSEGLNRSLMEQLDIRYLVTKEAGSAGGFAEKLLAADSLGVTVIVIGRPPSEGGVPLSEARRLLMRTKADGGEKRRISMIGIGMGGPGQMTAAALEELKRCDVLFGAGRMADAVKEAVKDAVKEVPHIPIYAGGEILGWLAGHPEYRRAGVLYSGDTGFYSGASDLAARLSKEPYREQFAAATFPGISSISYLCARLNRSWERVGLLSLHGRDGDVAEALEANPEVFVLLGGKNTVKELCGRLIEAGHGDVTVTVGERLSYPEERIVSGTPAELAAMEFDSLAAVLIERKMAEEGD